MDRRNVIGLDGTIHQGLFNPHTGFFIDLACDAGRYAAVRHYEKLDPECITDLAPTCTGCTAAVAGETPHPADVARMCADVVLADADRRGHLPALDNEALRLAFVRLAPAAADELRPVLERLARGVYDPENNYRTEPLYDLIQEHLADDLTARALTEPEGEGDTPRVLVKYTRFTGGEVQSPVRAGDRLMHNGITSGMWYTVTVLSVESSGIAVRDNDGWTRRWDRAGFHRWFSKLDRLPQTQSAAV
jgi:hypothetical protein